MVLLDGKDILEFFLVLGGGVLVSSVVANMMASMMNVDGMRT